MHPASGGRGSWRTQVICGLSPPSPQSYPKKKESWCRPQVRPSSGIYQERRTRADSVTGAPAKGQVVSAAALLRNCVFSHASCVVSDQGDRAERPPDCTTAASTESSGLFGLCRSGAAVALQVEVHEECKQRCDVKQVHLREALREGLAVGGQEEARLGEHARELDQLALGEVLLPPDLVCVLGNACGRTVICCVSFAQQLSCAEQQRILKYTLRIQLYTDILPSTKLCLAQQV